MQNTKARMWLFVLGMTVLSAQAFAQKYVVVVHPDNDVTLTKSDVANLFQGRMRKFGSAGTARPIMQEAKTAIGDAFMKDVVNKTWSEFKSFWSKRMFSGRGYPPKKVKSDHEVKAFISKTKSGIGYISADSVDGSVKVILKF